MLALAQTKLKERNPAEVIELMIMKPNGDMQLNKVSYIAHQVIHAKACPISLSQNVETPYWAVNTLEK